MPQHSGRPSSKSALSVDGTLRPSAWPPWAKRRSIRFTEHLTGDGPTVFDHICRMGLEGIVSKRTDAPYRRAIDGVAQVEELGERCGAPGARGGVALSKVQSVDQRMRLGMRCRLSPTADVPSHTSGQLCAITSWEQMQQVAPLFEDFVGSREQCSRHFEAERFGGLDVEHGFVFRRSLHREVGWFLAFQDAVDVGGGKPIQGGLINPEGDQSAFGEETAEVWDRMEP